MLSRAKVKPEAARQIAVARSPGRVQSQEIEEEGGKLLYSFDIKVRGKPGIDEVQVDAMTGAVLSVAHEGPADEAREHQADGAATAGSPTKPGP